MTDFDGIVPSLSQALTKRGYSVLTPVQIAVLAPELKDADTLVSAQTGSGKTVAFGIAIAPTLLASADKFSRAGLPMALVVAPTRELALQVKRELDWLYEMTGATIASCVGGMDMRTERRTLERGAHIVVGTPGRLRDHIERGSLELTKIRAVVLDEADEMLDLGFRDDLEYILDAAPGERRTLMFSATVPRSIANLATRYQRDAVRVSTTAEREQHLDIEYQGLVVAPNDRENAIINVLRFYDPTNALVFCGTRATVNHMTSRLNNRGFSVVALSGELSQNERTHALQAMRDGRARVCVATDVAARGIDLPNLDLVIHADIPRNSEALLHRSGRTGRAGRKGTSALIVPHNARRRTERLLSNANIEATWGKPPSLDDITKRDRERILDDVMLTGPLDSDEQAFAKDLLARHGADQVAAAFLRLHRAGQPAPEELLDAAPLEAPKPRRDDFKNGVWFSLSVGRNDQAETRWLLPMLCRAGHITKNEIGAIRIQQTETHFELVPHIVDKFLEAVGPTRKVEKNIEIIRLEGIPEAPKDRPQKFSHKKKPYRGADSDDKPAARPKRTFANKPDDRGDGKKPWVNSDNKPKRDYAEKSDNPPTGKKAWSRDAEPERKGSNVTAAATDHKKPWVKSEYKPKRDYADRADKPATGKKAWSKGAAQPERKGASGAETTSERKKPWVKSDKKPARPFAGRTDAAAGSAKPRPKPAGSAGAYARKASEGKADAKKPWDKRAKESKAKPTAKPRPAYPSPKFKGADKSGSSPLQRKKPNRNQD
ncbi:MAG: DEAD/DEAH box helicase [Rhodospirillales bacterium]|nr:DEAD/DEAH box helicase [Rhodospirillales bacterium]